MFIPNIDFIGEKTVTMAGSHGNENNVPVFSYLAKYKDSEDVVIHVNKRIGGTRKDLEEYAWKVAGPLGRIPAHTRRGTNRINVNYGKKNQVDVIIGHYRKQKVLRLLKMSTVKAVHLNIYFQMSL